MKKPFFMFVVGLVHLLPAYLMAWLGCKAMFWGWQTQSFIKIILIWGAWWLFWFIMYHSFISEGTQGVQKEDAACFVIMTGVTFGLVFISVVILPWFFPPYTLSWVLLRVAWCWVSLHTIFWAVVMGAMALER
ncbi:MAG: hypothetical protein IKC13_05205 [Elusimicrobiaceae bacterium]|nr:hypothetical protein [Elusimicrobiaceae bacterium]